ncbi:unnamed protein product [Clavelina lepadiformis]|uniref:Valine--tRNA ligase, mitochondrial n=1 Tax=Clavelina lepadiformis TaxID=159417 RepID=A0ABP0H1T3_CLALP
MLKVFSASASQRSQIYRVLCIPQCSHSKTNSEWDRKQKQYRRLLKQQTVNESLKLALKKAPSPTHQAARFDEYEYTGSTVPGEKKDVSIPLQPFYSPVFVEKCWYDWWKQKGFFSPKNYIAQNSAEEESFSMVIPPPNVTGKLHLGHALTTAIEDTIVRRQRMLGKKVLWLPGSDHAGIATQMVVEREIDRIHGKSRYEIGRDKFINAIWKWRNSKGNDIFNQLERLGASLDWGRQVFTLDEKYTHAVEEAFIRLHREGLIYRDERCVNWSCQLQSTLSDLEVDCTMLDEPTAINLPGYSFPVQFGVMHKLAYKLASSVGDITEIVVATTRLETVLADAAIAVNPNDSRYSSVIGRHVKHPLWQNKHLPIIADYAVDMELGTGALKVTPAHDFTDFEIGKRHDLPFETCFNPDGTVWFQPVYSKNKKARDFSGLNGLPRFVARERILDYLTNCNLYRGSYPHQVMLRTCNRTGDVVEPMIKKQWFVRISELAKEAINAVEKGQINLIQKEMFIKQWKNWLNTTGDWCISRQIWWGHQVPSYECTNVHTKECMWFSAHNQLQAQEEAMEAFSVSSASDIHIKRDNDVLDTWFSSALFPFASLGWPTETEDYKKFYPLSLMETGSDLIFFWVARMAMMGLKLTGKVPFENVLFHPMVRDKYGRKMSKSVGNVIDPLHVIDGVLLKDRVEDIREFELEKTDALKVVKEFAGYNAGTIPLCGSDALRLSLCAHSTEAQSVKFNVNEPEVSRKQCNKIWNIFLYVQRFFSDHANSELNKSKINQESMKDHFKLIDKWSRSQLALAVETCNSSLNQHNIAVALQAVNYFWRNVFSSIYLVYCTALLGKRFTRVPTQNDSIELHLNEVDLSSDYRVAVALNIIDLTETALRLFSPFAPYLAEELWQRIPHNMKHNAESVCIAPYPLPEIHNKDRDAQIDEQMKIILSVADSVNQQATLHHVKRSCPVVIVCKNQDTFKTVSRNTDLLRVLTQFGDVECHTLDNLKDLLTSCAGSVDEDSDVSIVFRFSAEGLRAYIENEETKFKHFETSRNRWIKKVDALEKKAQFSDSRAKALSEVNFPDMLHLSLC